MRVPAKLNLHLTVGPLRDDGFHDLVTVFHAVSVCDEITVERGEASLVVEGDDADLVPRDGSNLALRAVRLLADRTGCDPGVAVRLVKRIPVAGGCAGGSADAAAALVACDALWGTGLSRAELADAALALGSDVPFCLSGGTALATGRGEHLTPVLSSGRYAWVLAVADGGLSTPAVYGELDRRRATGPPELAGDPAPVLTALRGGDPAALGRALSNDLQPAALALRPDLRTVLETAVGLGALGALVSGSGPTVAALAPDAATAHRIAAALPGRSGCRRALVAHGPVPGAQVGG